jgi:hypothetical protein
MHAGPFFASMRSAAANTRDLVYRHTSTDFFLDRRAEAYTQTFVRQAASWCAAKHKKAALCDPFVRLPPGLPPKPLWENEAPRPAARDDNERR